MRNLLRLLLVLCGLGSALALAQDADPGGCVFSEQHDSSEGCTPAEMTRVKKLVREFGEPGGESVGSILYTIGPCAIKPVARALSSRDPVTFRNAVIAMKYLARRGRDAQIQPLLWRGLDDPDERTQLETVDALFSVGDHCSVSKLEDTFNKSSSDWLKLNIAITLGQTKAQSAVPFLLEVARNNEEDISTRRAAMGSLSSLPGAATSLLSLVSGADESILPDLEGLMNLFRPEVVPPLIRMLDSSDSMEGAHAQKILCGISGEDFGYDTARWHEWWGSGGKKRE